MNGIHTESQTPATGAGGLRTTGSLPLIGLFTSLGAVFTGWCCVLPSALAALGAGGAGLGSVGGWVAYQPYFLGVALLSVTAGWISFARRRSAAECTHIGNCARPMSKRRTFGLLAFSTLLLAFALAAALMQSGL